MIDRNKLLKEMKKQKISVVEISRKLGISRQTFYRKLKFYFNENEIDLLEQVLGKLD